MQTLPTDAADLTPSWMSEALGTEVTDVELLDHAFATNQRARLGLTYATADAGPPTLFVKLAPLDPVHREMIGAIGMGDREAQFYADVAPTVELLVPRCYFGASDDDNAFVLLLEDLGARGCQFASNGEWGVSADAGAVALEQLARFHARFEDAAERARVAPWLSTPSQRMSEATSGLMRMVLDAQAEHLSEDYAAIGELYVEHHAWFDEIWHSGPATYIHGDTHIGNVYLDDGQVGFLDWGLSRVSTHLRDVSYFMTMSIDIEERRAHRARTAAGLPRRVARRGRRRHQLRRRVGRAPVARLLHRGGDVPGVHAVVRGKRRRRSRQCAARALRRRTRRSRRRRRGPCRTAVTPRPIPRPIPRPRGDLECSK